MARGRLNKQIAFDLGISEVTVKLHRGNVMRKMEVASIGELIRAWETLPAPMREAGRPEHDPEKWPSSASLLAFIDATQGLADLGQQGLGIERLAKDPIALANCPRLVCDFQDAPS